MCGVRGEGGAEAGPGLGALSSGTRDCHGNAPHDTPLDTIMAVCDVGGGRTGNN